MDPKILLGILLCQYKINKSIFREFAIWFLDFKYPDRPVKEWELHAPLIAWIVADRAKKHSAQGIKLPSNQLSEATEIAICLQICFSEEEQANILQILSTQ